MAKKFSGFEIPFALVERLIPAGDERESLTARHLERARQCCYDLLRFTDECAPSTRVLLAYLVLLHDSLAVLAAAGWRVAPCDGHVDAGVLEVLARALSLRPAVSEGVLLTGAVRAAELDGSFASNEQARCIQAAALDAHGIVELQLEGRTADSNPERD